MREVVEAIYTLDDWQAREWKTGEIADRVTISERDTWEHLKTLVKHGYLDSWRGGPGNALHLSNICLGKAGEYGHVEFSG